MVLFLQALSNRLRFCQGSLEYPHNRTSFHDTICGKPDELHLLPERKGEKHRLQPVLAQEIKIVAENLLQLEEDINWYQLYFKYIRANINLERPANWTDALNLYRELLYMK